MTQNIKNIRKKQDNYPPKNTGLQTIRTYVFSMERHSNNINRLRTKKEQHLKKKQVTLIEDSINSNSFWDHWKTLNKIIIII